jgi:hypothetical protein
MSNHDAKYIVYIWEMHNNGGYVWLTTLDRVNTIVNYELERKYKVIDDKLGKLAHGLMLTL